MDEAIAVVIASVVTGICAIIVGLINSHIQANATRKLIEYKIEELTKRVEKHNNVVDRTYELEKIVRLHEEQIDVANHRLKDLEDAEKEKR
ncbi:MAG: hypothetical protein IJP13_01490 [Lachnospiraceae bacterium]|nr:hypothetical protein [Lachnospiraceae bacterium]